MYATLFVEGEIISALVMYDGEDNAVAKLLICVWKWTQILYIHIDYAVRFKKCKHILILCNQLDTFMLFLIFSGVEQQKPSIYMEQGKIKDSRIYMK